MTDEQKQHFYLDVFLVKDCDLNKQFYLKIKGSQKIKPFQVHGCHFFQTVQLPMIPTAGYYLKK